MYKYSNILDEYLQVFIQLKDLRYYFYTYEWLLAWKEYEYLIKNYMKSTTVRCILVELEINKEILQKYAVIGSCMTALSQGIYCLDIDSPER